MRVKTPRRPVRYNHTMSRPNSRTLTPGEVKDLKVLAQFTAVYCQAHHAGPRQAPAVAEPALQTVLPDKYPVCSDCAAFLAYACERRLCCPLEDKPACKHCQVHCYKPGHREKVRAIMRFSGRYLIRRGRLDLLWHYFC
jgi:hypothetical protein